MEPAGFGAEMGGWAELLHSSNKLLEQSAPPAHFPALQRNLDQLEALSTKLKAKTLRADAPSHAATRLLAREGIDAEQLTRDLKSFELKATFEDVFPYEARSVEEYIQQLHEMAVISSIEEAQNDNLRRFGDHMMKVLQDDWQKEKRDFLQSLNHLSTLPRRHANLLPSGTAHHVVAPHVSSSAASLGVSPMEVMPVPNKAIIDKKAVAYAEVVCNLNEARRSGQPFQPATGFRNAYEGLNVDSLAAQSCTMQKLWHLVQALVGEGLSYQNITKEMRMVIGARGHLELGHEKHILDTIHSHPAQASLGGSVDNLQKIRAFLRVRMRDHGVLDFDATDLQRQPPVDTTWQQIYYCLRTGYYDEARQVAQSSRAAYSFASQLADWIVTGGAVSQNTALIASEECEKMLKLGDRPGRPGYNSKKLLLYAMIAGNRNQIDRLLRDFPKLFNTIEDFLWFKLSAVRKYTIGSSGSSAVSAGFVPYSLEDLQIYLNKFEPSYYTKNGRDPLVYPYIQLLSIQLFPAVFHLNREVGEEGYNVDAVHIAIALADHGVFPEGVTNVEKIGVMDASAEAAGLIRQYGSSYLHNGNLALALEYYIQAAAAIGGGEISWTGRGGTALQRQHDLMLRQLLTELLLRDGGIQLLLGPSGSGDSAKLGKYIRDWRSREQFLLEVAHHCQEAGLYEKALELCKRVEAFAMALDLTNKCLSDVICALSRGGAPDLEGHAVGFIHSGNDILQTAKYSSQSSLEDQGLLTQGSTVLRQLEAILFIHQLARTARHAEALNEIVKLPFLPLDSRPSHVALEQFKNLSTYVQSCVPGLLLIALTCLDHVRETDVTIRGMRSRIASFVASNMNKNWPRDLYEKVTQSI